MPIPGKQIGTGSDGIKAVNVDTSEIPTLAGTSVFTGTVQVPSPSASNQAANKSYVDSQISVPTILNKNQAALVTTLDGSLATNSALAETPIGDGYIAVMVDGLKAEVGDGDKLHDCYFSSDGGTTPKQFTASPLIAAGDLLFWNGSVAGFQLSATDVIDFDYNVASGGPGTSGILNPQLGGTGSSNTSIAAGDLLIGNNSGGFVNALLTPGANISVANASGSVTVAVDVGQDMAFNGFKAAGLADPTSAQDAVTLSYLGAHAGGPDSTTAIADEDIGAALNVYLFQVSSVWHCVLADSGDPGKPANGWAFNSITSGNPGSIWTKPGVVINTSTNLTPGQPVILDTAGQYTAAPPGDFHSTTYLYQIIGFAGSHGMLYWYPQEPLSGDQALDRSYVDSIAFSVQFQAGEDISAGQYVWLDLNTFNAYLANRLTGRVADLFAVTTATTGNQVTCQRNGGNTTALVNGPATPNSTAYLDINGGITTTRPVDQGSVIQRLGRFGFSTYVFNNIGEDDYVTNNPSTLVPSGTTQAIDLAAAPDNVLDLSSATGDVTVTFSSSPLRFQRVAVEVLQGSGARNVVGPGNVKWAGGVPVITSTPGAIDLFEFLYDGTNLLSLSVKQNLL